MNTPPEEPKRTGTTLRWILILAGALVLLVVLFYVEEDWKGGSAWSNFKRSEAAEGEKLDFKDLIPPPVADDQNFAMTPLLRPALDYVHTTNGIRWRDTNAWQHLEDIRIDAGRSSAPAPKNADLGQDAKVHLKIFADFYRGSTNYPQSAHPENDAEVILTALNKFEPELKALREAAATRPHSRFPIEYNYEPPAAILLPHLDSIKGLAIVCDLRAIAELETHRSAEALADLKLGFRLSDSIRNEPILIDHLVRIATLNLVLQGIREGLIRHAWSDAQLAELETNLASIDLLGEYEHAMRGERALGLANIDYVRRNGLASSLLESPDGDQPASGALQWMPSGWYRQNMVLMGEYYRDYILPAVDASNRMVMPAMGDQMMADLSKRQLGPYNVFVKLLLPAIVKAAQRTTRMQTLLDETRVACAIERHRLEHADLPDTLGALVPKFIPNIPNDLFDGKPLRYKKNSDGTYLVYSIGWNEKDDAGIAGQTLGHPPRPDPNQGDWVSNFSTNN